MKKGVNSHKDLNKELSHVCWLLSETCNSNCASVKESFPEYLANNIYYYGFPNMRYKWDNYYSGWWVNFRWPGYVDKYQHWIWLGENKNDILHKSSKNFIKTLINDLYWWDIENGKPIVEEYIWDEYYFGWWKYSEWNTFSNLMEWRWIG